MGLMAQGPPVAPGVSDPHPPTMPALELTEAGSLTCAAVRRMAGGAWNIPSIGHVVLFALASVELVCDSYTLSSISSPEAEADEEHCGSSGQVV